MAYRDLLDWMFNLERFGIKLGLDNTREFLSRMGNPERDFRSIHITGTNGKGSACAFVSSILRRHGMKVGLYTSPHLVDFRERIKVDGREIPSSEVVRLGNQLKQSMLEMAAESPERQLTFFEFTTGMAFKYFSEEKVDIVVAEVGMGGRLDATNVLCPEVAGITRIGLEHAEYLGSTIASIAREKAGIIKDGTSVVTCERNDEALSVISNACKRKGAKLRRIGRDFSVSAVRSTLGGTRFDYSGERKLRALRTRLIGEHQAENAALAIAIAEEMAKRGELITDEEIRKGISMTKWPGRLDIVSRSPLVILDGSHNPDGVATTAGVLRRMGLVPLTFVLGCMDDKDATGIAKALAPSAAKIVVTQVPFKRALNAGILSEIVRAQFHGPVQVEERPVNAFHRATSNVEGKGVCVIGSLYLVGEIMREMQATHKSPWGSAHKV
jgi:dihydrofolate synthase/folylpolyglutamate synthase